MADQERSDVPAPLRKLLDELYQPDAAEAWLRASNPRLRGGVRPIDLVARGDEQELYDVLADERAHGFL